MNQDQIDYQLTLDWQKILRNYKQGKDTESKTISNLLTAYEKWAVNSAEEKQRSV